MTRAILALLAFVACSTSQQSVTNDPVELRTQVTRLEAEARSLAQIEGCSSVDKCRMAPVGSRPCGGPRLYIAYCAATTDSVALFKKLDELKAVETRLNQLEGTAGTCEFRTPPMPGLVGGRCGP